MTKRALLYLIWGTLAGAVILYGFGKWQGKIDAKVQAYNQEVQRTLKLGASYRARQDSLKSLAVAAQERARIASDSLKVLDRALAAQEDSARQDAILAQTGPLADLLPKLQLTAEGPDRYVTDSTGVRFLAGLQAEVQRAHKVEPILREQIKQLAQDTLALRTVSRFHAERADSAEARVDTLETLLREGQNLGKCWVVPHLVPCPSRTVTFITGVALGTTVAIVLKP